MKENGKIVLMNPDRVARSLKRIAYQVAERNGEDLRVLVFGIQERGYVVSKILAGYLDAIVEAGAEALQLDLEDEQQVRETLESVRGKEKERFLVVADDVIFSGRTMFSTLREIDTVLDLDEIYTVALVDRGHRKFPVEAEFSGMELPTKLNEEVQVITEGDAVREVLLTAEP